GPQNSLAAQVVATTSAPRPTGVPNAETPPNARILRTFPYQKRSNLAQTGELGGKRGCDCVCTSPKSAKPVPSSPCALRPVQICYKCIKTGVPLLPRRNEATEVSA